MSKFIQNGWRKAVKAVAHKAKAGRPATKALFFVLCAMCASASRATVLTSQSITLNPGWNAVYIEVSPQQTPDEVFASWPVASVGLYDPASFLSTRQFSSDWSSQGLPVKSILMWQRDYPELTQFAAIPPGVVAVTYNTNEQTSVVLTGVPAAPRITWHKTDTNSVQNVFGFSLQPGASVNAWQYLEGFAGIGASSKLYKLSGSDPAAPTPTPVTNGTKFSDGMALFASSTIQDDWSGVLFVSPMTGPDFGSDSSKATLSVRNDGEEARTVAVALETSASYGDLELPRAAIHVRDAAVALTNAAWAAVGPAGAPVATKRLAAGETWNLEFGIDRPSFDTGAKGRSFGALLRVTDVDGGSKMRVDVPLVGETSGATANRTWPGGLWVADVEFDRIVAPGSTVETETGGTVKLRLPIHIDANGTVRLLQRVVTAGEVAADGTYTYRLYAGTAEMPATARQTMRISAVCLPTEIPVVEAAGGLSATAPGGLTFEFTVAGGGSTSLLRHPLHPQHDGLRWDFKTAAPSGDDFANYKGDVKPETFSVRNEISLAFDLNGGEAAWNPEETKSGRVTWKLTNLMRQGPITLVGDMTIKRVSPQTEIVLE